MNPYQFNVTCDVCGGEGVARHRDIRTQWLGGSLRHSDPEICAENLKMQREELERREKQLNAQQK